MALLEEVRRWRSWLGGRGAGARRLKRQGDALRVEGRLRDAGVLYGAAADFCPDPHLRVQAGHMFKEAGDWAAAERSYLTALADLPDDVDLAVQLGHFYKVAGRPGDAVRAYRRAAELVPGHTDAVRELDHLRASADDLSAMALASGDPRSSWCSSQSAPTDPLDTVVLRRFGSAPAVDEPPDLPVLKGVESIRGICVSAVALDRAVLLVDGRAVGDAALVPVSLMGSWTHKHVFNIWYDFGALPRGPCSVEVRIVDALGTVRYIRRDAFVGTPPREAEYPDSEGVVDPPPDDITTLDAWIGARASMIRPARSGFFTAPPRTILVIRADQLGDMVVSVPALRRLRALMPQARLIGLVTAANADLARSLGLFDVVETIAWNPAAPTGERRLTPAEEERVRKALEAHRADVAIDLLVNNVSRPFLALSGARFTAGFGDVAFPWMTLDQSGHSHDVRNGHEMVPHAARLLALVERFATVVDCGSVTIPLLAEDAARLARFGLVRDRYAVLHAGGRYVFSRWPGYRELAERLLAETELDLMILDEEGQVAAAFEGHARVRVLREETAFADFDALLGFAAVFVGNDSGPKHLAALRGTPVVSVHSARIDWREWAQTQTGLVVTRRLPCAGCALNAEQEDECGRGYACINDIHVDEVVGAVMSLLG